MRIRLLSLVRNMSRAKQHPLIGDVPHCQLPSTAERSGGYHADMPLGSANSWIVHGCAAP
ncbi:hypothetical protein BST13_31995 [Mycobacterium aquaticum]|uniref:Uncharacterized protein n=1 Tax=Mycobacterium aquaticum TaxID=1927124 RepID=A0A1X0A8C1_9MYCO|nr:hypothetical protein BST13_31995 [Mycobacterium aquaticum]